MLVIKTLKELDKLVDELIMNRPERPADLWNPSTDGNDRDEMLRRFYTVESKYYEYTGYDYDIVRQNPEFNCLDKDTRPLFSYGWYRNMSPGISACMAALIATGHECEWQGESPAGPIN